MRLLLEILSQIYLTKLLRKILKGKKHPMSYVKEKEDQYYTLIILDIILLDIYD